jgi:hypothetical protein
MSAQYHENLSSDCNDISYMSWLLLERRTPVDFEVKKNQGSTYTERRNIFNTFNILSTLSMTDVKLNKLIRP